jgi:hypothetical protein
VDTLNSRLQDSTGSLSNSSQVILGHSSSAENVPISEVLRGQVTDWEHRKDDFGSRGNKLIKFTINDVPFSIDNLLEVLWLADPNLSVILLGLELELNVKDGNLWLLEFLWLLLETSI